MSEFNEKKIFEKEFLEDVIDIVVVIGLVGIGVGMFSEEMLWIVLIDLIVWKSLDENEVIKKEEIQFRWLVDEEEVEKVMNLL